MSNLQKAGESHKTGTFSTSFPQNGETNRSVHGPGLQLSVMAATANKYSLKPGASSVPEGESRPSNLKSIIQNS